MNELAMAALSTGLSLAIKRPIRYGFHCWVMRKPLHSKKYNIFKTNLWMQMTQFRS